MVNLWQLLRHRWLDQGDVRRSIDPALAERLRQAVAASELQHSGQIRICVEAGLPSSYLWRHLRSRLPMAQLVRQRALMMFSKLGVWDTEHNNGVLIYLLLAERAIELVADRGAMRCVGPQPWQAAVQQLEQDLHAGQFDAGLLQAVQAVTQLLTVHFPRDAAAGSGSGALGNELPDEPVLL